MILITGAAGKTGTAILKNLAKQGASVRCLVRNLDQAQKVISSGAAQTVTGDLNDPLALEQALTGVDGVYFIAPNVSPDELSIGHQIIELARRLQVQHFVYHSVLHPQIEAMPHHWQKMRVEETLINSGLDFTILQPCAYMQNILGGWSKILQGQYHVPYNLDSRINIVDLEDIARIAAKVLLEPGKTNAIYELAGPEALTQYEVADQISKTIGKSVQAIQVNLNDWESSAKATGMGDFQRNVLLKMFNYYDKYGFMGNSSILEFLLSEKPVTFMQFLARISNSGEEH